MGTVGKRHRKGRESKGGGKKRLKDRKRRKKQKSVGKWVQGSEWKVGKGIRVNGREKGWELLGGEKAK